MEQNNLIYARFVSPGEIKSFLKHVEEINKRDYQKSYNHILKNKDAILANYQDLSKKFEEIEKENTLFFRKCQLAKLREKCICGADVVFVEDYGFWGCTNYKDKSVQHLNFIDADDWKIRRYLTNPWPAYTSDWLKTIKDMSGLERKVKHSSLFKFIIENGGEDLSLKHEGFLSETKFNRLKGAKKRSVAFERKAFDMLADKYGVSNVWAQQGIKYQYYEQSEHYAIMDFFVFTDTEAIIYECKTSESDYDERQKERYIELTSFYMKKKNIDLPLTFKYITENECE